MMLAVESSHARGDSQWTGAPVAVGSQILVAGRARRVVHCDERRVPAAMVAVALGTVRDIFFPLVLMVGDPGVASCTLRASRMQCRPGRRRPARSD